MQALSTKKLRSSRLALALTCLGIVVTLATLIAGVPLFVRMPPWCDLTLYDVAARTVIQGGTLYEDVFDTNLPGFVWCLIGIRRAFGNSVEAVRIIDLLIVAAITVLLIRYLRKCGADFASLAWLAASVTLFYPFTTEFSHCQRDVWMTLPMLLAVMLRVKRISTVSGRRKLSDSSSFENRIWGITPAVRSAMLEGALWGVTVWFKPHVMVIAIAVWFVTRPALRQQFSSVPRVARQDFVGNIAGGLLVGLLGIIALVSTGTWKPFIIVLTKWNQNYLLTVWGETGSMFLRFLNIFPPWSLLHVLAIPLAARSAWRLIRSPNFDNFTFRDGVLAVFYLAVLVQACLLQRNFDYVHIPEMLLAFAVATLHLPRVTLFACLVLLTCTLLHPLSWFEKWCVQHPMADHNRMKHWTECFRNELTPIEYRQRQQSLALSVEYFSTINVVEIGEVADFLRTQNVTDGDVIAWHDSPHAIYLELGLKPCFRFMHVTTTLVSEENFARMTIELRKKSLPKAQFIVTDILHPIRGQSEEIQDGRFEAGSDLLPPNFTWRIRHSFPWDQPAIFRSGDGHGRYLVHRIVNREPTQFEFQWLLWE